MAGLGEAQIGVFYLARGADEDFMTKIKKFHRSYINHRPGLDHKLCIILKGFSSVSETNEALNVFRDLPIQELYTDDNNFDLGAYRVAAQNSGYPFMLCFNTNSEILADDWLLKYSLAFDPETTGILGATGSYESLWMLDNRLPRFPNIHIRSNAFLIRRKHVIECIPEEINGKLEAFMVESGSNSITRQILRKGLSARILGRNGRTYGPDFWPHSGTFRQGRQENLIVHDNVTRTFNLMTRADKEEIIQRTWGQYFQESVAFKTPYPLEHS